MIGEIFCGGFLAEGVELIGREGIEIDEWCAGSMCGIGGPLCVAIEAAFDFAIGPVVARRRGADDEGGALRFGVGRVLANVPAVGVNGFFFARGGSNFL